jgi:hypothetical protein
MDNQIDFANIWKKQKVNQFSLQELQGKLKQFRKANLNKILLGNILLVATMAFILFIWIYFQPQFLSTKVGIIITIVAIVLFVFSNNQLFLMFNKLDITQTNHDFVKNLTIIKAKQKLVQTRVLSLYFLMLASGICLYMYEYTSRMTMFWAMFTYIITLAWIAFNWFYVRPTTIKKQTQKIDDLISKFGSIEEQFSINS